MDLHMKEFNGTTFGMLNQMCLIFGDPTEEEIQKLTRLEQRMEAEARHDA